MRYLEAKRLAHRRAQEAKMDEGPPENKAVLDGPANKSDEGWPYAMAPETYIRMNADSDNPDVQAKVALARRITGEAE